MSLSINSLPKRLPRRFPIGATYVVEGYGNAAGDLRVISRYVVLPGGQRINVRGGINRPALVRAPALRGNANPKKFQAKGCSRRTSKKFARRAGTGRPQQS